MDKKYLNEAALKDLIRRFSTSNDPYAQEDLDTVEKAMLAFHNYVNTVVDGEMKLLIQGSSLYGQEYRDAITQYDGDRHSAHEKAIGDAKLVSLSLDPTYYCKVTAKAGYKAERYY